MFAPICTYIVASNCVYIERGNIPPYYKCKGCLFEEAALCVDDIRRNKSYNVPGDCKMLNLMENPGPECCPRITYDYLRFRDDLSYISAAYPMALRCIESVGCKDELIYSQLLAECESLCPDEDPRPAYLGNSLCTAPFNGASTAVGSITKSIFDRHGTVNMNTIELISKLSSQWFVPMGIVFIMSMVVGTL